MNNAKNAKSFKIPLTFLIILLLAIGVMAVYFNAAETEPTAFFARSIDDASYDCEKKIADKYGETLLSKTFDELSSNYNSRKHQYIIFYWISIQEVIDEIPMMKDYLAKCIVWEKIGYVSDFTIIDP